MALKKLISPIDHETAKQLKAGDRVTISGRIVTARDQVHKHLFSGEKPPLDLDGMVIYHCGPVTVNDGDTWRITAAGPTTSMREEPYEAEIIRRYRPAAIMGKGGMGAETLKAMQETGCVYLNVTGGAAQYLARCIKKVEGVMLLEFGQPEAMWVLEVEDLPALVTMDSHGRSLHADIAEKSTVRLAQLFGGQVQSHEEKTQ